MRAPVDQSTQSGTTGSNGTVIFKNILKGDYIFQACKLGYITKSGYVNVVVGGITELAITLHSSQANFTMSGLEIEPSNVEEGGTVTISIVATNTGGQIGSHTVTLEIDNEVIDKKTVTLSPYETEVISFEVVVDHEGAFLVVVDGQMGNYTVIKQSPWKRILGFPYKSTIIGIIISILIFGLSHHKR